MEKVLGVIIIDEDFSREVGGVTLVDSGFSSYQTGCKGTISHPENVKHVATIFDLAIDRGTLENKELQSEGRQENVSSLEVRLQPELSNLLRSSDDR